MCCNALLFAQQKTKEKEWQPLVNNNGRLVYTPDSLGNRIIDFSYCGYKAGEKPIPFGQAKLIVPLQKGDATATIQHAMAQVAELPADSNRLHGAVQLLPGTYHIAGTLTIPAGVVLRGSGMLEGGTVLLGTGYDRQPLISIEGKSSRQYTDTAIIRDDYVPVNAMQFTISSHRLKIGDNIIIHLPFTDAWINLLGTGHFGGGITALGWKANDRFIDWQRTVTAVNGNTITIDAPLTTAIDKTLSAAMVITCKPSGVINNCGIENMRLVSGYDSSNKKDEAHRWMAININAAQDVWVRRISFEHFAGSAVAVWEQARRVTVEDCISRNPVSEIGGWRRNTFFTNGQQVLFQRCYAENGYHDFATGFCTPGPVAFVQCTSHAPYSFSGGIDSWSSGVLMDVVTVEENAISFLNRGQDAQGAGWNAANSVLWNCSAARIDCYKPPTANNYAFGSWSQFAGDGYWAESNNSIEPRSLYYAQLEARTGKVAKQRSDLLLVTTDASSSPSAALAANLTAISVQPATTLLQWIEAAPVRNPLATATAGIANVDTIAANRQVFAPVQPMSVTNGWVVKNGAILTGSRQDISWWNGNVRPAGLDKATDHITRFVPGRTGRGLTDNLEALTDSMQRKHVLAIDHNYALWYDRRRDDHERVQRMDGDVWPPYYELPFARTGEGIAYDGLSKYDLTKYNKWYWNRLHIFADLADQKGLVLFHQDYFQHNIIEAGAHYADFPWRTANNINSTQFPEPPPYAGDKRIFMAEQFYDTTNAARLALHKAYIRKCLDNFAGNSSVVQFTSAEFTGPLQFVQFWLNTIRQWEQEKQQKAFIALSTTKDVQDSILSDDRYNSIVNIIDIRYWHYDKQGNIYAPKGGQNLAPRQHARLLKPKNTSFEQVYRSVKDYRLKYPGKAVMYSADNHEHLGWAVLLAGGSFAEIPVIRDNAFLKDVAAMQPLNTADSTTYLLGNNKTGYVVYTTKKTTTLATGNISGVYELKWIDPQTGIIQKQQKIKARKNIVLNNPLSGDGVAWLRY